MPPTFSEDEYFTVKMQMYRERQQALRDGTAPPEPKTFAEKLAWHAQERAEIERRLTAKRRAHRKRLDARGTKK